ncbi:zeta toxin family protein [Streptomyces diastatochromogenes]|nr:zeta toxin family protein [Streptomyces diastatochromogenes]
MGPLGSVVRTWPAMRVDELVALTESNTLPGGLPATGTDAEGFVLRFASGLRAKAKLSEYVRLHKVLTGVTERDIWRGHGIQRFAGVPAGELAKGLGCAVTEVEADGGKPLDALLEQVPDEFDAWVREVITRLETAAADRERAVDEAYAALAHLAGDRAAFARAAADVTDRALRALLFLRLDGRRTDLLVWRQLRPGHRPLRPRRGELTVPVVHLMTGLPASGKTTAARALQAAAEGRMRRVNLDDLRAMLDVPHRSAAGPTSTSGPCSASRTRRSAPPSTTASTSSSTTRT